MNIQEILARYAQLKIQERALTAEIEELNPQIKEHLLSQGIDKLPTTLGTFTVSETSRWKYSSAVEKLQELEKATGIAIKVGSTTLRFTPPKGEKEDE